MNLSPLERNATRTKEKFVLVVHSSVISFSGGSSYGRSGRPPPIDQNSGLVMAA